MKKDTCDKVLPRSFFKKAQILENAIRLSSKIKGLSFLGKTMLTSIRYKGVNKGCKFYHNKRHILHTVTSL